MPSETTVLLRSIRRWLQAITFLLAVGVVTLAHAGYTISGYRGQTVFGAAMVVGGTAAIGTAGAALVVPAPTGEERTE